MLSATVPSGLWLFGIRYFVLEVRPPAHWRASASFFPEIPRPRPATDRGRGTARTSVRSEQSSHSTPCASGSPAAISAHSPAFSLPAMMMMLH